MSLPAGAVACPDCGAPCQPDEAFCWMCRRRLWNEPDKAARPKPAAPATPAAPKPAPAPPQRVWIPVEKERTVQKDSDATMIIIIASLLILVLGAMMARSPLGLALLMLMAPAFLVTALSERKRSPAAAQQSSEEFWAGKLLVLLRYLATGFAVMTLIGLAFFMALFAVCAFIMGHH